MKPTIRDQHIVYIIFGIGILLAILVIPLIIFRGFAPSHQEGWTVTEEYANGTTTIAETSGASHPVANTSAVTLPLTPSEIRPISYIVTFIVNKSLIGNSTIVVKAYATSPHEIYSFNYTINSTSNIIVLNVTQFVKDWIKYYVEEHQENSSATPLPTITLNFFIVNETGKYRAVYTYSPIKYFMLQGYSGDELYRLVEGRMMDAFNNAKVYINEFEIIEKIT